MDDKQRRELARELASLADKAVAMADHEPGSERGDKLDSDVYHMYQYMAKSNYGRASKVALEILGNLGLTVA